MFHLEAMDMQKSLLSDRSDFFDKLLNPPGKSKDLPGGFIEKRYSVLVNDD